MKIREGKSSGKGQQCTVKVVNNKARGKLKDKSSKIIYIYNKQLGNSKKKKNGIKNSNHGGE